MNLIFLGAPGTGKGTQAKILAANKNWPHISTGDILRAAVKNKTELGQKAKSYMDAGKLVPDSLIIEMVAERFSEGDCDAGFILDGFPRTINQAQALDAFFEKEGKAINKVIALEVEAEALIRRLTSRRLCRNCGKDYNIISNPPPIDGKCEVCGGEIYQRTDDNEETVSNRLKVYEEQTTPLKDYYKQQGKLNSIDANKGIEEVQREIKSNL
jgi:adenylate kinase